MMQPLEKHISTSSSIWTLDAGWRWSMSAFWVRCLLASEQDEIRTPTNPKAEFRINYYIKFIRKINVIRNLSESDNICFAVEADFLQHEERVHYSEVDKSSRHIVRRAYAQLTRIQPRRHPQCCCVVFLSLSPACHGSSEMLIGRPTKEAMLDNMVTSKLWPGGC